MKNSPYPRCNSIVFFIVVLLSCSFQQLSAQTKGLIYKTAAGSGQAVLDPNIDGFTSESTAGYWSDDEVESEIQYTPLPSVGAAEPDSDLGPGPSCGFTDLVKSADNNTIYTYLDGSNNLMFRFRLGGTANNSKGYSILIDTDQKFGATGPEADPNYVPGNPGFEIEVVLRTNFGVGLYDVDGTVNPVAMDDETVARPYTNFAQKSIALSEICGDDDYFYDFYIPFSDITLNFPAVTPSTPLRMVGNTVINPKAAIGNNGISDLGGIDDSTGITDGLWQNLVDVFPPTSASEISSGATLPPRAACPSITGPLAVGATSISGSSTEINGTMIEVFRDGVSNGTTLVSGGTWSLSGLAAFTANQLFTATARVPATAGPEKSTSYSSCNTTTVGATCSAPPTGIAEITGNKKFRGNTAVTGTYTLRVYKADGTLLVAPAGTANPATYSSSPWEWEYGTGGTKIPAGAYYFTITASGSCESTKTQYCTSGAATSAAPTILNQPVVETDAVIQGTASNNASIAIFINGVEQASTAATGGNWSFTVSSLPKGAIAQGDVVRVRSVETGKCGTSTTITIGAQSATPAINGNYCATTAINQVSGISSETPGASIVVYTRNTSGGAATSIGNTTVGSNGSWIVTGLSISVGTYITATAQTTGEDISEFAIEVLVNTKTPNPGNSLIITSNPITEGDSIIEGEALVSTTSDLTVQLYIDGTAIQGATTTIPQGALAVVGTWSITGLDTPFNKLYAEGVATVTITSPAAGFCESDPSAAVVIQCKPPINQTFSATTATMVCEGESIDFFIDSTESNIVYQLVDQLDNRLGSAALGDGSSLTLVATNLSSTVESISVKAQIIGITCETILTPAINVTISPTPIVTLVSDALQVCRGETFTNLSYTIDANGPAIDYNIDFDLAAEAAGLTDVINETNVTNPIVIAVPGAIPAGVYNGVFTLSNSNTLQCISEARPFTITVNDIFISSVSSTNPTSCNAADGTITIEGLEVSTTFDGLNYKDGEDTINHGSFTSDSSGNYTINALNIGNYTDFVVVLNGCDSNIIPGPIILSNTSSPTITLNTSPTVTFGTTNADLPYTATTNGADQYIIDYDGLAEAVGFVDVSSEVALPVSPISLTVPATAPIDTYFGTISVINSTTGCVSIPYSFSITVESIIDTDGDGIVDSSDTDDDNDGVLDSDDNAPLDPSSCQDTDGDGCDDCSATASTDFTVGNNFDPSNDGIDTDWDGLCDAGDTDDDNDGVLDGADNAPLYPSSCQDLDADGCDDCSATASNDFTVGDNFNPANDGTDTDGDGLCDTGDTDDDNDGVLDGADNAPLDPSSCQDTDADGCDDCSATASTDFTAGANFDTANDGTDTDGDGLCDAGDTDDDNDGNPDTSDPNPLAPITTVDVLTVTEGTTNTVNILTNDDFIPSANTSLVDATTGTANGIVSFDATTGIMSYTPAAGEEGTTVTIDYTVCNTAVTPQVCETNTVSITVEVDTDGDGTPDSIDTDDDNDGVLDGADNAPIDPSSCQDLDSDGCDDCSAAASTDFTAGNNFDPANDGTDTDGDGICDLSDNDDDNDGILDSVEGTTDFDNDGIPNNEDLDSDNDGIPDIVETGNGSLDIDGNGAIDPSESSTGTNGIPDAVEDGGVDGNGVSAIPVNSDNLGGADYLDIDSDNDGIKDLVEAQSDAGLVQASGNDSDSDGIDDVFDVDNGGSFINTPENTDGDSHPDYLDLDSDDDGIIDNIEWQSTTGYLSPSVDSDGNGLADNYEVIPAGSGQSINEPENSDGVDGPDFRDLDSDNDGLDDTTEAYDIDGDNTADTIPLGTDTDNDGLDDAFDLSITPPSGIEDTNGATNNNQDVTDFPNDQDPSTSEVDFRDEVVPYTPLDTDGDGINNDIDIDNDNDGILDYVESLGFEPTTNLGDPCNISPFVFTGTPTDVGGINTGAIGDQYRFANVNTINGTVLDAIITITERSANITSFDIEKTPGDILWNMEYGGSPLAIGDIFSMEFNISFVLTGTLTKYNVNRIGGTIADIDGANFRESIVLRRPGLYAVDSNSFMTISNNLATGFSTFLGPNDTWPGVDPGARLAVYFNYYKTNDLTLSFVSEALNTSPNTHLGSLNLDVCSINGLFDPNNTASNNSTNGGLPSGPGTAPVFTVNDGIDSDNDGISNKLDIDSDNDGIPDNVEAQLTASYTPRGLLDSDNDGLGDAYEGTGNQGISAIDTDLDGIYDYLDLDSDNDGFTDTKEAGFTLASNNLDSDGDGLLNGYDDVDTTGTLFDSNDDQDNGASDLPNIAIISTPEVDYREVGIDDNDLDGIADVVDLDDDNDGILDTLESPSGIDPSNDTDADGILNYKDEDLGTDANGDGIVDSFDADGDGVPNHFDLDADNDGIYDVVESSSGQPFNNGRLLSAVGTDGIPNSVQASGQQNSGNVNYIVADSETSPDGIADYLELDADGDGCNDVIEAGYTDDDSNGILGDSPTIVDADGLVTGTNVSDGYTTPNNEDAAVSNTQYDFQQPGVTPNIATAGDQPQDILTNGSSPETFTVNATGIILSYQWQVDDQLGGGFIDIDPLNGTDIYANSDTATLTLTGITGTENGYQYRAIITEDTFVCSPVTSSAASITYDNLATIAITTPIEVDGIVNAIEDGDVTISGTTVGVEDGQIVTVTFFDGTTTLTTTATVTGGVWTATDADISGLTNGPITVDADVTDVAGNVANNEETITLDNTNPTIVITTPIEGDGIVNAIEDGDVTSH